MLESLQLAQMLVESILNKKGSDILLLDIRDKAIFADYFLLCSGENDRQLKAIAEEIEKDGWEKAEIKPMLVEGRPDSGWVLVDYSGLAIHIFTSEQRAYYNLEELWADGHVVLRVQ